MNLDLAFQLIAQFSADQLTLEELRRRLIEEAHIPAEQLKTVTAATGAMGEAIGGPSNLQ